MKSDDGYLAKLERKLERMRAPGRSLSSKDIIKQLALARQSAFDTSFATTIPVVLDVCSLDLEHTVEHKRLSTRHAVDASELVLLVSDDWLDKIHCGVNESAPVAAASASASLLAVTKTPPLGRSPSDANDTVTSARQDPDDSLCAMQESSAGPNSIVQSPWPLPVDLEPAALFDENGFGADDCFIADAAAAVSDDAAAAAAGAAARAAVTAATPDAAAVLCDQVVGAVSVSAQSQRQRAHYTTGIEAASAAAVAAVTLDPHLSMNASRVAPASADNFEPLHGADR